LADGQHADDALAVPNRRRHVHHRGPLVVWVVAGGAGAVLTAQGQVDIVPAGIVLTDIPPAGVEQHYTSLRR
jgi:hypothetical protein